MRRLAILDHFTHRLIIDEVSEEELDDVYDGEEEAYIRDNFTFKGDYSWDWIVDAEYYPLGGDNPIEINFEDIADI